MGGRKSREEPFFLGETAVWWDFDECPLPEDRDCDHVSTYLKLALGRIGSLSGQLQIFAFGDVHKLPNRVVEGFIRPRQRLRLTQLNGSWMRRFIEDWIKENPITKTYLIISNDLKLCESIYKDFIKDQDRQLFTAHTRDKPLSLFLYAASIFVWNFSSLLHAGNPEKSPTNFKKYIFADADADDADHITFPPNLSIFSSFSTIDFSRLKLPVWWDIESCPVPKDCEVAYVPSNIQCSLLQEGLHGRFTLFVDTTRIWKSHINRRYEKKYINIVGLKYSREEMIKAMAEWGDNSPPQSTCVLISCDVAYERILRNLGCKHNVVVGGGWPTLLRLTCSPYGLPISYLWEWGSLAHGDLAIRGPTRLQCKVRSLIAR